MQLEYFQMVDRIVDMDLESNTIEVEALVPVASPVFEGHFPGHPLLPGTLMIETMAQALGFLVLAAIDWERMPLLTTVSKSKIRKFIAPGTRLQVKATLIQTGQGYAVGEAEVHCEGTRVANAELRYVVQPFPSEEMRAAMIAVNDRIMGKTPA